MKQFKQRSIVIDVCDNDIDGATIEMRFSNGHLHLEDWINGMSFLFFAPCKIHGEEVCWSQWLWIDEPQDESSLGVTDPNDEFGWWMI